MNYEPKILVNKTDKTIEFFCGGNTYIFQPGEQRPMDGFVAFHALKMVNTGLSEIGDKPRQVANNVPIDKMSWKDLRSMKDVNGDAIYKMGMDRKTLIEEIRKHGK